MFIYIIYINPIYNHGNAYMVHKGYAHNIIHTHITSNT